jgi:hypothetical protein
VHIANPIYDVVFKYLLDDEKVARIMLSALLGKEVLELEFRPTEVRQPMENPDGSEWLVLRMDFSATLRLADGSSKLVLIEIQKASSAWDVQRFRRYLGSNYCNPENVFVDSSGRSQALPLLTIYFLGEGLEGIDVPVLKVNRYYLDVATGDEVRITDPFVEALTHDSIVVQINRLKNRRRTDLERLLAVFDQGQAFQSDPHLLDILEENFPLRYRDVLRRLLRAGAEKDIRDGMDVEDDVVAAFQEQARKSAQALEEKDRVIEEKDHVIEEKDHVIEEKDHAIVEKDKVIEEKDRIIADLERRLRPS